MEYYLLAFAGLAAVYILFALIDAVSKRKYDYRSIAEQQQTLSNENKELRLKIDWYDNELQRITNKYDNLSLPILNSVLFSDTLIGETIRQEHHTSEQTKRIVAALDNEVSLTPFKELSFTVIGSNGNTYITTLNSCTCPDFVHRRIPCKHMYRVAIELGQLSAMSDGFDRKTYIQFQIEKELHEKKMAHELTIVKDKKQHFPYLSKFITDAEEQKMSWDEWHLRTKQRAALKAADFVAEYRKNNRSLIYENKCLKNQLEYLEHAFPWLEEFRTLPPEDGYNLAKKAITCDSEYEYLSHWISAEEWEKLNTVDRYQIVLDRYSKRKKSSWEIGRDYERYVGYKCEQHGFRVQYYGATQKLEDLGRDVIASNNDITYIIQCKYWREERTVREKNIFQLYGTLIMYRLEHPEKNNVQGLFITSCALSEQAKQVADYLNILVKENYQIGDYPMVKCNISETTGEKIYHLPFDLQYDKVVIEPERGEFYAMTVADAENAGFRRAKKWRSAEID